MKQGHLCCEDIGGLRSCLVMEAVQLLQETKANAESSKLQSIIF